MQKLGDITWAWGLWRANNYGTGLHFTQSTRYDQATELDDYHQYQCTVALESFAYDGSSLPEWGISIANDTWYDNDTAVTQSSTCTLSGTTTRSASWTKTRTLNVGVEISATEGMPGDSVTAKLTTSLSLSTSETHTDGDTQTWTESAPLVVPAQASTYSALAVNMATYNQNWIGKVRINGMVAIWFDDRIAYYGNGDDHYLWFIPIEQVLSDVIAHNLYDTSGYEIAPGGGIYANTGGVFTGSQGIRSNIRSTQHPLRPDTNPVNAVGMSYTHDAVSG